MVKPTASFSSHFSTRNLTAHTLIVSLVFTLALLFCHNNARGNPSKSANISSKESSYPTSLLSTRDYSFGYWIGGTRKHAHDKSKRHLCLETGYYGLTVDLTDIKKCKFGLLNDALDYDQALASKQKRISSLADAQLDISITVNGTTYHAVTPVKTKNKTDEKNVDRTGGIILWESARYVQNFELQHLEFQDPAGNKLPAEANLTIIAWPQHFSITTEITPTNDELNNAKIDLQFKTSSHNWHTSTAVNGAWKKAAPKKSTLSCDLNKEDRSKTTLTASMPLNNIPPVSFNKEFNCYLATIRNPKRAWKTGYTDIRNYDEINITIDSNKSQTIPFLLELYNPANITGLCPILCDEHGVPTGIPVQLSKNWHYKKMGAYLRAYALLPATKGKTTYKLRIAYGYYGTLPSASHGQLSLVGYGGNGRWDQLAIGCWGETYCMDLDMSLVDVTVTDVRMLMARNKLNGEKWTWTDAGWGGDWLNIKDDKNRKHYFNGIKTAYHAHGPCLTEVNYSGSYGAQKEAHFNATVRTLRTNDYARTFTTMKYQFNKKVRTNGWLFKMGRTGGYTTPQIAYGNKAGLIKQHQVRPDIKHGETFIHKNTLSGKGPWWVSFPGATHHNDKDWGTGYRALVIRSYKATIGGKEYHNPSVSFPAFRSPAKGKPNLDFILTAPKGIMHFHPNDTIEFEVEWITLPRNADDYYGTNETFRQHVKQNPSSWKTTHREAIGNDLTVNITGGKLLHNYPIIIQSNKPTVKVEITGGVGYVPIRFEGLTSATGYTLYQVINGKEIKLDQSVHKNDFWQTDYDTKTKTYKRTYNLPLDNNKKSTWILRSS